jgi:hypothetical protein
MVGIGIAVIAAAQGFFFWFSPPLAGAVAASTALYFGLLGVVKGDRRGAAAPPERAAVRAVETEPGRVARPGG